jgi:hypothetical protein
MVTDGVKLFVGGGVIVLEPVGVPHHDSLLVDECVISVVAVRVAVRTAVHVNVFVGWTFMVTDCGCDRELDSVTVVDRVSWEVRVSVSV